MTYVLLPHTPAGKGYARLDRVTPEGLSERLVGPKIISFRIDFAKSTDFSRSLALLARLIGLRGLPLPARACGILMLCFIPFE